MPKAVTLFSASGKLGATLVNNLDQPVTVLVRPTTDGELTLSDVGEQTLGPGARTVLRYEATSDQLGVHNVRLAVTSVDGAPLGSVDELPIRAARVSALVWVAMAVGALVLFGMIGYRLPGQIRARRAELAAASRGEDGRHAPTTGGDDRPGAAVRGTAGPGAPMSTPRPSTTEQRILASSAVMAAGTVFSRASGYIRSALLVAALGAFAARRPVHHRQHAAQHGLHPAGRRHLQRRPRAAAGAPDQGRPRRR